MRASAIRTSELAGMAGSYMTISHAVVTVTSAPRKVDFPMRISPP